MFKKYYWLLLIFLLTVGLSCCQPEKPHKQHDISSGWQFKREGSTKWFTAEVPGVVHTDLLANGLIPEPFIGNNEDSIQWIEKNKWVYKTQFSLAKEDKSYERVDLVFDGLDTYAEVFLNGRLILNANNMFRKWQLAIKDSLLVGKNELKVIFTSPLEKNKEALQQLGYSLPAGSETGEWRVSPFTRKAAYQFGWDFAPRVVSTGIWQNVYLDLWQTARIKDVLFEANNINKSEANYTVYLTIFGQKDNISCKLTVLDVEQDITLNEGYNTVAVDISISNPALWWPNGWGEAHLYDIPIKIKSGNTIVDSLSKRLGIRTVELVQKSDAIGRSFYLVVNGEKLFAKGANWSPLSSFPSAVPDSTYVNRLNNVKKVNMNMLRVWVGESTNETCFMTFAMKMAF